MERVRETENQILRCPMSNVRSHSLQIPISIPHLPASLNEVSLRKKYRRVAAVTGGERQIITDLVHEFQSDLSLSLPGLVSLFFHLLLFPSLIDKGNLSQRRIKNKINPRGLEKKSFFTLIHPSCGTDSCRQTQTRFCALLRTISYPKRHLPHISDSRLSLISILFHFFHRDTTYLQLLHFYCVRQVQWFNSIFFSLSDEC